MEATLDDGPEADEVVDEKPSVPPYKCAKISDASAEAIMFRLRDAPRGLTYCVDEASTLISSLGEYKKGGGGDHERLLRLKDGKPLLTDNGCMIIDLVGLQIADPKAFEAEINNIVGVVTVGLFAQRGADVALLGTAEGVQKLTF